MLMGPKELIKLLDKAIDGIQAAIEKSKASKDFTAFDVYMKSLEEIKTAKNYIFLLINEKV